MKICLGPSRASGAAERSTVAKESLLQQRRFGSHSTKPKPDGAARDPQVRRQYIWVDENGITPGCPRCEGRGTTSHPETCRKRFDAIQKKKFDKQLQEAVGITEPPPVIAAEMEVEQPHEQPSTGGASSSSAPGGGEVNEPSSSRTRPLEGGDESSSKRVRSLSGMLLFDENDTSDWQHSIWEAHVSELSIEHHTPESIIDHMQQPDTSPVCGDARLNRNLICVATRAD